MGRNASLSKPCKWRTRLIFPADDTSAYFLFADELFIMSMAATGLQQQLDATFSKHQTL